MPPSVTLKEHSKMVLEDVHKGERQDLHKYIVGRQLVKTQRSSPTFVQKREIFERRTHKSKALKVMHFLSRPIGVVFGLSSLFYHHCDIFRQSPVLKVIVSNEHC